MSESTVAVRDDTEVSPISPEMARRFAEMAMTIPDDDAGGMDRIIEQIIGARSWEDLNAPWESTDAEKLVGHILKVDKLTRRPSDFRSGLGIFLVVRSVDVRTHEEIVWTTGSIAIVAQLVQAYLMGAIPCFVEIVIAERPTEAGFRPHHLKFHGVVNPVGERAEQPGA
jgi:hypothetical protein